MDADQQRRLQAQVVNLGLVAVAVAGPGPVGLRCECGERSCRARILVGRAEYERRARGFDRVFVLPGHGAGLGAVTHVNDRFAVVDLDAPRPLLVEMLSIDGCPHAGATLDLVEAVAAKLEIAVAVHHVVVDSARAAARLRFLGSPTVRVNGVDVEPGSAVRCDYALGCRLYRTTTGTARIPAVEWIGAAFTAAASGWPTGSGGGVLGGGANAADR
jgi:hypothetical protein